MVDTNSNPEGIDHIIPGNDDAIRSIRLITKVISDACARGLASSQGGVLNIQTDDEAPPVKVKKASVTSGKVLNIIEKAELSEPDEDLAVDTEEASNEIMEDAVESNDESSEIPAEEPIVLDNATEDSAIDSADDVSKEVEEEK